MSDFERKILENGQINPKYIDLCDEDPRLLDKNLRVCLLFPPKKY